MRSRARDFRVGASIRFAGVFRGDVSRKAPIAEVTPSGKVVEVPEVQPSP